MRWARWILLGAGLLVGAAAPAGPAVYVNGEDARGIAGLGGKTFEGATVRFDDAGNVFITLKDYVLEPRPGEAGKGAVARPAAPDKAAGKEAKPGPAYTGPRKFYLVTEVERVGYHGYDVEVWVNGKSVGVIKSADGPLAVDIDRFLRPKADNRLKFVATKRGAGERKSTSSSDFLKIVLVEGHTVRGSVVIDRRLLTFTRTAADVASGTTEYDLSLAP